MIGAALALAAALPVPVAVAMAAPQDGGAIVGGPMAGMFRGPEIAAGGRSLGISLLPSRPNASRPSADVAAALRTILDAEAAGDMTRARRLIADGAKMSFCSGETVAGCRAAVPFEGFAIPGSTQANTPYALGDGLVRVEWISQGRAAFVSFVRFTDGKLAAVRTGPAVIPAEADDAGSGR